MISPINKYNKEWYNKRMRLLRGLIVMVILVVFFMYFGGGSILLFLLVSVFAQFFVWLI